MSQRAYATLAAATPTGAPWQIHYRAAGAGVPVILLHPSPLSSAFMEPLITLFSKQARAIAWDTPGYGQSDPLPQPGEGLDAYVQALHEFIATLELDRPLIYGSATGAQIAIEYGKACADNTRGLLLENVAWFFDAEREQIMQSYFPDIRPERDGSHLQLVWKMASQVYRYFPWYDTSKAALVRTADAPLELLQKTVVDHLLAGQDYAQAYRAAFMNERPEPLQSLQIPTHLVRWQDSIIKAYSDRLDDAELPANIKMYYADTGMEARFLTLEQALTELF